MNASPLLNRTILKIVLAGILFAVTRTALSEESSRQYEEFFWGAETNGVQAGLHIAYSSATNQIRIRCQPYLRNSQTNNGNTQTNILRLWLPPPDSRYRLTLWDEGGRLIRETAKDKAVWKPITEPLNAKIGGINFAAGFQGILLLMDAKSPNAAMAQTPDFILQDYFQIQKPGKYRLKFEMRVVWIPRGWRGPSLATLIPPPTVNIPPVEADIQIKPAE